MESKLIRNIQKYLTPSSRKGRIVIAVIFVLVLAGGAVYVSQNPPSFATDAEKVENAPVAFTSEVYTMIQKKHWSAPDDATLVELYEKAVEKVTGEAQSISSADKEGVLALINSITSNYQNNEEKQQVVAQINDIVLANLEPFGRSRLFTTQKVQELRNTVANKDPQANLYNTLEVEENASQEEVQEAYQKKQQELSASSSPQAQQQLEEVKEAYDTLAREETRQTYNETGAQATVVGETLTPRINYIKIKQMSPLSFNEFQRVAKELDAGTADSLILDLRDNIGGAIDILPYFLGPFIGPNTYAYEFHSQGENVPFKTKTGWLNSLVRYKKVVVLINENTQSSGEVMAATLKKYNVGVVVGTTTKGWGTVENTFPVETELVPGEQHSLFLVHSVTLRDDGKPIEGRGVDPMIATSNANWQDQILSYFNYPPLVREVAKLIN